MENYSYSSYPDSGDSSPRSREIDCENASFDEPLPPNYKVKFMCSYGGKIQPRPHDNQLSYVGGDTKILAVDRHIRFPTFISKLNSLIDTEDPSSICFKYQLPGEDLDALISVTNDEDLEHMLLEYDRLHRTSSRPARLRLFLFSVSPPISAPASDPKSDRQWFVDALNSAPAPPPIQSIDVSSPPAAAGTPDFLFGLDKSSAAAAAAAAGKLQDQAVESTVVETSPVENLAGSDLAKEVAVESEAEIQRQILELQRLPIANQEQGVFQRRSDEGLPRAFPGDFYVERQILELQRLPKPPEKAVPPPVPAPAPAPATVPVPAAVPQGYWQERQMMQASGYAAAAATGVDQPVYFMSSPAGVYQPASVRPVTSQVGQGYYVQRMMPDVYREQAVYSMGPPPPAVQKMGPGQYVEGGMGVVRPQVADAGAYTQMGYDSAGRQVYYTTPGGVVPAYQTMAAATTNVDVRQAGGALNPEGKVGKPTTQAS